uniref:Uncharacterized protein n=1 Tax=Anguilla anguilla TaxID=7936 RepID=A0A0E9RPI0_ANGAN
MSEHHGNGVLYGGAAVKSLRHFLVLWLLLFCIILGCVGFYML